MFARLVPPLIGPARSHQADPDATEWSALRRRRRLHGDARLNHSTGERVSDAFAEFDVTRTYRCGLGFCTTRGLVPHVPTS